MTEQNITIDKKYRIIEDIRLRRNLTYEALAAEIGLSPMTLFNILAGRTNKHYTRTIYKIERWLNGQKS